MQAPEVVLERSPIRERVKNFITALNEVVDKHEQMTEGTEEPQWKQAGQASN